MEEHKARVLGGPWRARAMVVWIEGRARLGAWVCKDAERATLALDSVLRHQSREPEEGALTYAWATPAYATE
jgi:hypothetical protein